MTTDRDPHEVGTRIPLAGDVRDVADLPTSVVLDSVSDLVVVVRVEPGPTFRMLTANRAYVAMLRRFGFAHEMKDLEGKLFTELLREFRFSDEVSDALLGHYEAVARSKKELRFEEATPTPRGMHHGEVTLTPILDAEGRCRLILYTTRDVTERKNAEAQLQHLQKLEAMGMLAGGIAHDFNNILAAIMAFTDVALMESAGRPAVVENLEGVLQACSRAAELVRQILAFSRKQKLERVATRLQPVVVEVQRLMRATLPSNIEIATTIDESAGVVLADSGQIHQVLVNLCTNAAQAVGGGPGHIEIEVAPCEVDGALASTIPSAIAGAYVRVDVSDDGPGMAPETLARVFEPFFTTKGPGEGTGLGLSVVHGIVHDHEGAIDVSSEPGRGTRFRLLFPRYAPDLEEVVRTGEPQLPHGHGEHVLFVDDERALCDMGRAILTRLGYQVTAVTSPTEALAAVRERPADFDLLVTDLTMPVMTGIDLARAVLALKPALPVVLTTGFSASWTVEGVRAIGLRDLVAKPYSVEALAVTVDRHLPPRS